MDVDYFIDDVTLRSCPLDLNALRASESRLHSAVTDWDLGKQDGEAFVARYAVARPANTRSQSGKFKMQLGEEVRDIVPGDCVTVKRGVPHTYLSTGEEQGTFMNVIFNGSLYNMFKECDKLSDHGAKSLTVEQLGAIAGANKVKIVGPPLST